MWGLTVQTPVVSAGTTTNFDEIGGLLVTTLEDAYNAVRKQHPDVPAAVIVISSRPPHQKRPVLGHFAHSRWDVQGRKLPEIMIAAEGLRMPPQEVLTTLVHEGAHGLCAVRGIKDTSRRGAFHNANFKHAAEELGLLVERDGNLGWAATTLPNGVYDDIVQDISSDLIAYRESDIRFDSSSNVGGISGRSEYAYRCSCQRKIRVYEGVYDAGPILCGVCGDEFM